MRIMHLLASNRYSGAENVVCQIISMFKNENDIEMVYCSRDGQIREVLEEKDISFAPIDKLSNSEVKRVIDEYQPDIIHAHDRTASYIAAKVFKGKIIVHMHVNNNKGIKTWLKNALWTYYSRAFSHIYWVSNSSYKEFPFHKFVKSKSSILYNVISESEVYEKASADTNDYNYDVAYVGRLSYQKNPQRLLDVCHRIIGLCPEAKIAIVGTGEYAEYIKNYICENNLQNSIDYKGYMSNPLKLIREAKCLIMTSRFEGTPMVALEAQILGVPIVSTPVDGLIDILVNGKNGYLDSSNEDMVNHIVEIISNEQLRNNLSKASLRIIHEMMDVEKYKGILYKQYRV